MARVAGVDLPPNKRAQIGLTYIYGVGKSRATSILNEAAVSVDAKIRDLSEDELNKIRAILDARARSRATLKARPDGHQAFDGHRLLSRPASSPSLPVRGQRTHTNARTRKGPRKAAVAKKKAPGKK